MQVIYDNGHADFLDFDLVKNKEKVKTAFEKFIKLLERKKIDYVVTFETEEEEL